MTPGALVVEGVSLSLGGFRLRDLSFAVAGDEILVLLGPNGAGKSVSLETIAGFHLPASGRIAIGGREVSHLPPERRNVSLLFQDFGLFPHLTAKQNVVMAWRARRQSAMPPEGRFPARDVAGLLAYFDIAHVADRSPRDLSPGEKQRVALARALASDPEVFLLDEPFSALDARTRERLRDELGAFLRSMRRPAIFVTHDHADAQALGDRIVVMRNGAVIQSGAASEVFQFPANPFVAAFLGVENLLSGSVAEASGDLVAVAVSGRILRAAARGISAVRNQEVAVAIRAEDVALAAPGDEDKSAAPAVNRLAARIVAIRPAGALRRLELDCGFPLTAYAMARDIGDLAPGRGIAVEIEARSIHLMPPSPD